MSGTMAVSAVGQPASLVRLRAEAGHLDQRPVAGKQARDWSPGSGTGAVIDDTALVHSSRKEPPLRPPSPSSLMSAAWE